MNSAPMSLGPTEHSRFATRFGIQGRTFDSGSFPVTQIRLITPDYFRVLQIPLRRGRLLSDSAADQNRVLINETLGRRFFGNQDPVGQQLILGVMDPKQSAFEIAGVVGDVRDLGLDQEVEPAFYAVSAGPAMTLLIKTASDPVQFYPRFAPPFKPSTPRSPFPKSSRSLRTSPTRSRDAVLHSCCSVSSAPWPHCLPRLVSTDCSPIR